MYEGSVARPRKDPADRQSGVVSVRFRPPELAALLRAMADRADGGKTPTLGGLVRELTLQALGVSEIQNPQELGEGVSEIQNPSEFRASQNPEPPEGVSEIQNPAGPLTEAELAAILDPGPIELGSRVTPSDGPYAGARGTVVQLLPGDRAAVRFETARGESVTANYPLTRLRAV